MTSQIGMMNRNSVALASDSAVTWGLEYAYNTSDKIHQLAGRQPVGFMTCGLGEYMGVSWDRILGMYRERIGTREKDEDGNWTHIVKELNCLTSDDQEDPGYVEDFINFLDTLENEYQQEEEMSSMYAEIRGYIEFSNPQFKALQDHVDIVTNQDIYSPGPSNIVTAIVERQGKLWRQFSELFGEHLIGFSDWLYDKIDPDTQSECDRVISEEGELINRLRESYRPMMYKSRISRAMGRALGKIVGCYIGEKMWINGPGGSGLVIAGFGKSEEFPTMVELRIRSKWKGEMRYSVEEKYHTDCAVPFAQADQIRTIIQGISPKAYSRIKRNLWGELPKVIFEIASNTGGVGPVTRRKLLQTLEGYEQIPRKMRDRLLSPTDDEDEKRLLNIGPIDVSRLAPPDLAEIAEKLVDLESSIQYIHYGLGAQVGGEIDVASITKEDGLIWVKRKSKIDRELNPRVFRQPRDRARHI